MDTGEKLMVVYLGRGMGGIQVKILDILDYLSKKGEGAVLVVRRREGVFCRQMPRGVRIIDLSVWENWSTAYQVLVKLLRVILSYRPERVLAFADHTASLVLLIKLLFYPNLKVYISEDIYLSAYLKDQPFRRIRRVLVALLYRLAEKIFVLSPKHQEDLVGRFRVPRQKIETVNNWISPRMMNNQKIGGRRDIDVLFVGRLDAQKNLERWLRVISGIKKAGRFDIRAVLVGAGKQEIKLKEMTRNLKLSKNVDFAGYQDNPVPFYKRAKIFLLTSRYEGQPLVLMEAMNYEVVPVTINYDGVESLIDDGITGYIVDTTARAVEKINVLLTNTSTRDRLAAKAQREVRRRFGKKNLKHIIKQVVRL